MENNKLIGSVHSTESFGTVDGPGIRFVVFLQGCPMRCAYCHNPDTWEVKGGTSRTVEDILREYDSYKEFLKGGGITVTGGEPLLQIDFVTELFRQAKEKGIHTCLDTSGITFTSNEGERYSKLLEVTDIVMLDIKEIDDEKHRELTGCSNRAVLEFARFVSDHEKELWIRYVAVPGITDDVSDLMLLGEFLSSLKSLKALDVLPYHTMGRTKYEQLNLPYRLEGIEPMGKEEALKVRTIILEALKSSLKKGKL